MKPAKQFLCLYKAYNVMQTSNIIDRNYYQQLTVKTLSYITEPTLPSFQLST